MALDFGNEFILSNHPCSIANGTYTKTSRTSWGKPTYRKRYSSGGRRGSGDDFEITLIKWGNKQMRWVLHGSNNNNTFNYQTAQPNVNDITGSGDYVIGSTCTGNPGPNSSGRDDCNKGHIPAKMVPSFIDTRNCEKPGYWDSDPNPTAIGRSGSLTTIKGWLHGFLVEDGNLELPALSSRTI